MTINRAERESDGGRGWASGSGTLITILAAECGASYEGRRHPTKFLYALMSAREDEFHTKFLSVALVVISSV